jgi:hypothetical protein
MFVGTKVEGEPDLIKDNHSKAIINTNQNAYATYKSHQKSKIEELAEKESMKKDINSLKDDISDIKNMLKKLTGDN